jgi:hypothetical protein
VKIIRSFASIWRGIFLPCLLQVSRCFIRCFAREREFGQSNERFRNPWVIGKLLHEIPERSDAAGLALARFRQAFFEEQISGRVTRVVV